MRVIALHRDFGYPSLTPSALESFIEHLIARRGAPTRGHLSSTAPIPTPLPSEDPLAHPSLTPPTARPNRMPRFLLSCVYLLALGGLIAWEYRDHLDLISNTCEGIDAPPRSALYSIPYTWFLDLTHSEANTPVSVVAVPQNLDEILNNVCESREYFADLLAAVAAQHPAEIVLDKFYGPSACASSPQSTQQLVHAIQALNVPVIVGESNDTLDARRGDACLVRKPQVDFASPNVHHGLTRLNPDVERIPLEWYVVPTDSTDVQPQLADSLSWAAVKAYDHNFPHRRRLQAIVDSHIHPFARLNAELPRQTSTSLLCSAAQPDILKHWHVDCTNSSPHPSLTGKIVLIGAEKEPDRSPVLGTPMWGFDVQARYIAAMLSGSYLRAMPIWLSLLLFALFVIVIEGLPTLFEVYSPHWKNHPLLAHAFTRRRYRWVVFWTIAFILGCSLFSLVLGYLPPLDLFGDICLVVVTRLLFFVAESAETPLLHHETKGPTHV